LLANWGTPLQGKLQSKLQRKLQGKLQGELGSDGSPSADARKGLDHCLIDLFRLLLQTVE
jgi:hypothetical protein